MGFSPQLLVPGCIGLSAWGYWTYHILRGVNAIGGVGTYWAERGLLGKIAVVIWAFVAVWVVFWIVVVSGMAVFVWIHAGVNAIVDAVRSVLSRRSKTNGS